MIAQLHLGAFVVSTTFALAADAIGITLPPDWAVREDGTLVHGPSGALCPLELGGIKRTGVESKGPPDLGICSYAGENVREGLIRVRQYVRGAGETPLAIKNDETLIEPKAGTPDVVIAFRVGPGPERNGAPTHQIVFTRANNGLLIDCIGRGPPTDKTDASFEFAQQCSSAQPGKK